MKFITEDDLRHLYKKEPFTDYEIETGTRITPGARQFLADRGINMFDHTSSKRNNLAKTKCMSSFSKRLETLRSKRLYCKMKTMESLFLVSAEEILSKDVLLAHSILGLSKNFSSMTNMVEGESSSDHLCCQKCTGINDENFSDNLDDCFEISEFHIQLGKGKEMILLHRLRCALREIELDLIEFFDSSDENKQCEEVIGKVNQIINTLSQLICVTAGGERCQKKC